MGAGPINDIQHARSVALLTKHWGAWPSVSLYLDRCQVDTPDDLVKATWVHVGHLRSKIGKVIDFGAGDGRFAKHGEFAEYVGYEIDADRWLHADHDPNVQLINRCAFSEDVTDADLCIGNPPFVRNQDLPENWRLYASAVLERRTGVAVSGLANAWQYFFLLSLATLKDSGLCALVIPYEWVSRPSAKALRDYITDNRWKVSVYRLVDATFDSVLTTASITIVDKSSRDASWSYYEETGDGTYKALPSPSGAPSGVIQYSRSSDIVDGAPRAIRGLSPGTQKILTLTEGERVRLGLKTGRDVVPCITSLRHVPPDVRDLDDETFRTYYRVTGLKCWLIRTDVAPTAALQAYLDSIPSSLYQTATCLERKYWWKFVMPRVPNVLMSQCFKGTFPKGLRNRVRARAVGGTTGVFNLTDEQATKLVDGLDGIDIKDRVVAHSNGLRKIEIGQLNTLLLNAFGNTKLPIDYDQEHFA